MERLRLFTPNVFFFSDLLSFWQYRYCLCEPKKEEGRPSELLFCGFEFSTQQRIEETKNRKRYMKMIVGPPLRLLFDWQFDTVDAAHFTLLSKRKYKNGKIDDRYDDCVSVFLPSLLTDSELAPATGSGPNSRNRIKNAFSCVHLANDGGKKLLIPSSSVPGMGLCLSLNWTLGYVVELPPDIVEAYVAVSGSEESLSG